VTQTATGPTISFNGSTYEVINVVGDGSCFFRALSLALEKTEESHLKYRTETIKHIVSKWQHFQPFLVDHNQGRAFKSREDYASRASVSSYYATAVEIGAAADVFLCKITVFFENQIFVFGKKHTTDVFLQLKGNFSNGHFLYLRPIKLDSRDNAPKPATYADAAKLKIATCRALAPEAAPLTGQTPVIHPSSVAVSKPSKGSVSTSPSEFMYPPKTIKPRSLSVSKPLIELRNLFAPLQDTSDEEEDKPVFPTSAGCQTSTRKRPSRSIRHPRSPDTLKKEQPPRRKVTPAPAIFPPSSPLPQSPDPSRADQPSLNDVYNFGANLPYITINLSRSSFKALLDSGASSSCISNEAAISLSLPIKPSQTVLKAANQSDMVNLGSVSTTFFVLDIPIFHSFEVVQGISFSFILGHDFFLKYSARIFFDKRQISLFINQTWVDLPINSDNSDFFPNSNPESYNDWILTSINYISVEDCYSGATKVYPSVETKLEARAVTLVPISFYPFPIPSTCVFLPKMSLLFNHGVALQASVISTETAYLPIANHSDSVFTITKNFNLGFLSDPPMIENEGKHQCSEYK